MSADAAPRLTSLSAFFPAHNEAANLDRLVAAWHPVLSRHTARFEMIVVDDGSTDGTGDAAERLAARYPEVRVVRHAVNRGYGGALKTGLASARMDFVFFTDADLQFDPADLAALVARIADADLVTGYRTGRRDSALRRLNGWAWSALMRALLPVHARDVDCAFKLLRREALDRIGVASLRSEGAFISAELLARLGNAGGRIAEVPVRHLPRTAGSPTGGNVSVIVRAFGELLRFRRLLRRGDARDAKP
jgi:glycosyltransferase involved in cell wall biosynthesis